MARINLELPDVEAFQLKSHCSQAGLSVNAFVRDLIRAALSRDVAKPHDVQFYGADGRDGRPMSRSVARRLGAERETGIPGVTYQLPTADQVEAGVSATRDQWIADGLELNLVKDTPEHRAAGGGYIIDDRNDEDDPFGALSMREQQAAKERAEMQAEVERSAEGSQVIDRARRGAIKGVKMGSDL